MEKIVGIFKLKSIKFQSRVSIRRVKNFFQSAAENLLYGLMNRRLFTYLDN
jgi:hypothetical protein